MAGGLCARPDLTVAASLVLVINTAAGSFCSDLPLADNTTCHSASKVAQKSSLEPRPQV